ncbi:hypothetical protein C5Y96_01530 [Blastopirellula marina]|uniref:Uncharacterized protein n=1 Tax=Blastopirellula marina TaxID=124 RepID=A0A2S8G7K9_9BACT|nr:MULTISPECIES: hypothetical protein [Pirellulaceae]PQO40280.1 hypothetical protein C5Y96_01530 [Blastopirellula marina]RCS55828.1 hypothetical protein DTL36_01530 [Bremerella cremea]
MKKLDLQNGGLKSKLILHVEKLVFGLAILLVLLFVYRGTQQPSISTSPDDLVRASDQARTNIEKQTWDEVEDERWVAPEYQTAASRASKPIPLAPYETPSSFRVRHKESIEKRPDPTLLPLASLEVKAGFAPFAFLSPQQAGQGGLGMMSEGGPGGMPLGSGYESYAGGGYGSEMGMVDANAPPTLTPEQSMAFGQPRGGTGSKIEGKYFVAITGLAPLKKQLDLFESAFKDRANYMEGRDYPRYVHFAIERREQKPDGSWGEWEKSINVTQERLIARHRWAFLPDEVAPPEYLDPTLSFPMPPILLFNPGDWGRHSTVPKYEPREQGYGTDIMTEDMDNILLPQGGSDLPSDVPNFMGPGGAMGMGSEGSGGFMGPYGRPGMVSGMGGIGGNNITTPPPGMMRKPGAGRSGGMSMARGESGGDYGGFGGATSMFDAENKMFRFYDTSVVPNKNYQYRVQLWLEDPNNPQNFQEAPPARALEGGVLTRLKPERDKITKYLQTQQGGMANVRGQTTQTGPQFQFWRTTEFSEPSATVHVPSSADVLAGSVDAGRTVYNRNNQRQILRTAEPNATVLAMRWDPKTDVKALVTKELKEVARGSMVEYKGDLWILDPATYQFRKPYPMDADKKDQEYVLKTGYTLLDIRGGEDTVGRYTDENNKKLKVPGEILVLDDAGNIHIKSELEEIKEFAKFNFAKPEVKLPRGGRNPDDPYSMEGGSGYDEYSSGEGRRPRGRGRGE